MRAQNCHLPSGWISFSVKWNLIPIAHHRSLPWQHAEQRRMFQTLCLWLALWIPDSWFPLGGNSLQVKSSKVPTRPHLYVDAPIWSRRSRSTECFPCVTVCARSISHTICFDTTRTPPAWSLHLVCISTPLPISHTCGERHIHPLGVIVWDIRHSHVTHPLESQRAHAPSTCREEPSTWRLRATLIYECRCDERLKDMYECRCDERLMVSIHPSTYLTHMWRETYPPSGVHFVGHPSFACGETGGRFNPADDPVVFVAYDLFSTHFFVCHGSNFS